MSHITIYFLKLGAHIGSSISEYNYSSSLNQYLLGSIHNYYIIDLKKSFYLLKRALYFLMFLGISNAHLLFFFFLNNGFSIYFFYLIKKKNKHSFINDKWLAGSITNYKSCFFKILNTFISSNTYKKLRKKNFFFKTVSSLSNIKNFIFFKFLFIKILALNTRRSNYFFLLKKNKKYWKFFFFFRSFNYILKNIDCFIFFNDMNNLVPIYEFSKKKIPIIGLIDTNTPYYCNITYPIISNDDSILLSFFYINIFLNSFNIGNFYLFKSKVFKKLKNKFYFFFLKYKNKLLGKNKFLQKKKINLKTKFLFKKKKLNLKNKFLFKKKLNLKTRFLFKKKKLNLKTRFLFKKKNIYLKNKIL